MQRATSSGWTVREIPAIVGCRLSSSGQSESAKVVAVSGVGSRGGRLEASRLRKEGAEQGFPVRLHLVPDEQVVNYALVKQIEETNEI